MNQEKILTNTDGLLHPILASMDINEYASDEQIDAARELVNSLEFFQQNDKLINISGWSTAEVLAIENIYREWLILHAVYDENICLAPNKKLDEYWHYHILDTKKYMEDCQHVFGKYLHHYPYFGLTEEENQEFLDRGYALTQKLFMKHFGHELTGNLNRCSSQGCR